MRLRHAACIIVAVAVSVSALAQSSRRDGRWEVTTEMEMPGSVMKMERQGQTMMMKYAGKRLGDCPT